MDANMFKSLYDEHALFIYRMVQKCFGVSQDDAEDIVQQVFYKMWLYYKGSDDIKSYLFISARNAVILKRKQEYRQGSAAFHYLDGLDYATQDTSKLIAAVETLAPNQQQIIKYKLSGLDRHEIAKLMHVSPQTVSNQYATACKNLKSKL